MNAADEQSKNNSLKPIEGRAQTASKVDILKVIRKVQAFKLLKEFNIFLTNLHH